MEEVDGKFVNILWLDEFPRGLDTFLLLNDSKAVQIGFALSLGLLGFEKGSRDIEAVVIGELKREGTHVSKT